METKDYHVGITMPDLALMLSKDTCANQGITISKVYNAMVLQGKGVVTNYDAESYDCVWRALQAAKTLSVYGGQHKIFSDVVQRNRRDWQQLLQAEVEHLEMGVQPRYLSDEIYALGCESAAPLLQLMQMAKEQCPQELDEDGKLSKAAKAVWKLKRLRWLVRVRQDLRTYIPVLNKDWKDRMQAATAEVDAMERTKRGNNSDPESCAIAKLLMTCMVEDKLTLRSRLDDRPSYMGGNMPKWLEDTPGRTWTAKVSNILGWIVDFPSQTNEDYRAYYTDLEARLRALKRDIESAVSLGDKKDLTNAWAIIHDVDKRAAKIQEDIRAHSLAEERRQMDLEEMTEEGGRKEDPASEDEDPRQLHLDFDREGGVAVGLQ